LCPRDVGSAWTPCVRPTITVFRCARDISQRRSASAFASSRINRSASFSCRAPAVSRTSEEVRPKWKWRATSGAPLSASVSETAVTKAITSWFVSSSISLMRSTEKSAFSANSSTSSCGISPR
jgi:hypothetical protein